MRKAVVSAALTIVLALWPSFDAVAAIPGGSIHVNLIEHSFTHQTHHASGWLFVRNTSASADVIGCRIVVTFQARHSNARRKVEAHLHGQVAAQTNRRFHFHVKFLDRRNVFANVPIHDAAHCRSA